AAGQPQLDEEFGTTAARALSVGPPKSVAREAARARRAYELALREGAWIDEMLECSVRTEEVKRRLARLAHASRAARVGDERERTATVAGVRAGR
ncbi:MAG TPA: hypothetical protein VF736_10995, partial [Pyrinomonadaceae bacterium]